MLPPATSTRTYRQLRSPTLAFCIVNTMRVLSVCSLYGWSQNKWCSQTRNIIMTSTNSLLFRPARGAEYCDQPVCLCACLSVSVSVCQRAYLWNHWTDRHEILCADSLWSFSGGVALRYVLPVLRMTSRLAVMGATPARVGSTQRRRSITWCLWMLVYSFVFIFAVAKLFLRSDTKCAITCPSRRWRSAWRHVSVPVQGVHLGAVVQNHWKTSQRKHTQTAFYQLMWIAQPVELIKPDILSVLLIIFYIFIIKIVHKNTYVTHN